MQNPSLHKHLLSINGQPAFIVLASRVASGEHIAIMHYREDASENDAPDFVFTVRDGYSGNDIGKAFVVYHDHLDYRRTVAAFEQIVEYCRDSDCECPFNLAI